MTGPAVQLCIPGIGDIVRADAGYAPIDRRDHLRTPAVVIERVRQLGPIGLDPCAAPGSHVGAFREWYGPPHPCEDGLARSWSGSGLVYCFPPPRFAAAWADKISTEARRDASIEIVALLPADTNAAWLHNHVYATAAAICYWRGDLRCIGDPRGATPPRLIAYWGPRPEQFRAIFAPLGAVTLGRAVHRPTSWTLRLPRPFAVGSWIQQQGRHSHAVTEYAARFAADLARAAAATSCPPANGPRHVIMTRRSPRRTAPDSLARGADFVLELLAAQSLLCSRSGFTTDHRQRVDRQNPGTEVFLRRFDSSLSGLWAGIQS